MLKYLFFSPPQPLHPSLFLLPTAAISLFSSAPRLSQHQHRPTPSAPVLSLASALTPASALDDLHPPFLCCQHHGSAEDRQRIITSCEEGVGVSLLVGLQHSDSEVGVTVEWERPKKRWRKLGKMVALEGTVNHVEAEWQQHKKLNHQLPEPITRDPSN